MLASDTQQRCTCILFRPWVALNDSNLSRPCSKADLTPCQFPDWLLEVASELNSEVASCPSRLCAAGRLKKKYKVIGEPREVLYADAEHWVAALGDRPFMGGEAPNLADLSVFGVVRSITGTDTFMDLLHNTSISKW